MSVAIPIPRLEEARVKARRNDRVSATQADGTLESQGDSGVGYPVGRDDLNGTLARVTYRAPGPPPDLLRPPDDLYEGRPQVRSTWRKHLDAKRAAERRAELGGLVPKPKRPLER